MAKRHSIKGMGADIFLGRDAGKPEQGRDGTPSQQRNSVPSQQNTIKATFYLPKSTVDSIENLWLDERRKRKKLTKSQVVMELLEAGLKGRGVSHEST